MNEDSRLFDIFLEIQRGLPRQGPGNDACTLQALALCDKLPDEPDILDIGCGPGMQTVVLAQATNGTITAVDLQQEYLDQLDNRTQAAGVADRVETLVGEMQDLPFPTESFDLIWSEGAAYIMGFGNAVSEWMRMLKPGGYLAVSELVWLKYDPPEEVRTFFGEEYPDMTDVESRAEIFRENDYDLLGHFTLPDDAWWDHYYTPLLARIPALSTQFTNDAEALGVLDMTRNEIDMRRRFGEWYGYEFFAGRLKDTNSESVQSAREGTDFALRSK